MATSRNSTWIESGDTYRTGDAGSTPYLTIECDPGSGVLSLFFAGDRKTYSSQVESIDSMIAALQQLRSDTLRRMAPDWSHPYGPCPARSIAHTHCKTCGNDSVTHNRAECSIVAEQRDGTALPHPADDGAQVPHRSIVNRRGMAPHPDVKHQLGCAICGAGAPLPEPRGWLCFDCRTDKEQTTSVPAHPHPVGDGAEVPHRSIVNRRGMALHLIADHHLPENMADLLDVTAEALDKRHRIEHLNAGDTVYADNMAIDA